MRVNNISLNNFSFTAQKPVSKSTCYTSSASAYSTSRLPDITSFLGLQNDSESPNVRAKKTFYSAKKAQDESCKAMDYIAEFIGSAQYLSEDVADKIHRAVSLDFMPYTYSNGQIKREFVLDDNGQPAGMTEYDADGNIERKAEIYTDGSMKISDFINNRIVFASADSSLESCEKGSCLSPEGLIENPEEILYWDNDHVKYVAYAKDKNNPEENVCNVFSVDRNDGKVIARFLNGVKGRNFVMPKRCDSILCMSRDEADLEGGYYPTIYLENFEKSGVNNYGAKKALYYTFDGLMPGVEGFCSKMISESPVSYHEDVISKFDENFKPSLDTEYGLSMKNDGKDFVQVSE